MDLTLKERAVRLSRAGSVSAGETICADRSKT
jgi:hypothetical protein